VAEQFLVAAAKAAVDIVVAVAINYAVGELTKKDRARPVGWSPIKQPIPPRHYAYGHGRKPGAALFYESVPKYTLDVLAFCDGRTAGTNRVLYFQDDIVTYDAGTGETDQGEAGRYGGPVYVSFKDGLPTETAHAIVVARADGKWTSAHRADGTMTAGLVCQMVSDEKMRTIYPNGEIDLSIAQDWLCVYDWRDEAQDRLDPSTWQYSANPIVCWVHDEWYVNGLDWDRRFAPNLADLTAEADACDVLYPQAGGGTAPRYEAFVWYEADDDRKTVRDRFIRSMDGWMVELGDGSYLFRCGRWVEPTDILTASMLIDYSWTAGVPKSRRVNEVQPRFRVAELLFEVADTDSVVNQDSIDAIGRKPVTLQLEEVTNNNQAMRLATIKLSEGEALYTGEWVFDLDRLPSSIFRNRFHRAQIADGPSSLADVYVEFLRIETDLSERVMRVQVRSVDPTRYDFDVSQEGDGPVIEGRIPPSDAAQATITDIDVFYSDDALPRLRLTLSDIGDPDALYSVQWRATGDDDWVADAPRPAFISGAVTVETAPVAATTLQVQVQTTTAAGVSDWAPSPPAAVDATAPTAVTPPPTNFLATGGVGVADLSMDAPATPGFSAVKFRRSATVNYTDSVGVYSYAAGLSEAVVYQDTVAPGTWYYWAVAVSSEGVESVALGAQIATVT